MTMHARHFPNKVRALTEWPQTDAYPCGYAVDLDGRMVRLDKRSVDHLVNAEGRRIWISPGTIEAIVRTAWLGVELVLVAGAAVAMGFTLLRVPATVEQMARAGSGDRVEVLAANPLLFVGPIAVVLMVFALTRLEGSRMLALDWPDSRKLRRISGRTWVPAPLDKGNERKLAATTARLHDRITDKPAWEPITHGEHAAPIDLDDEVLDIIRRLHEISELRGDLGEPTGRTDPTQAQHEALDRAVLSIAQRIEVLADYSDQLEVLEQETATLERLERAERLQDKVFDIVSETAADPHLSVLSANVNHEISSVRATIAATTDALAASVAALASKSPLQEPRGRLKR